MDDLEYSDWAQADAPERTAAMTPDEVEYLKEWESATPQSSQNSAGKKIAQGQDTADAIIATAAQQLASQTKGDLSAASTTQQQNSTQQVSEVRQLEQPAQASKPQMSDEQTAAMAKQVAGSAATAAQQAQPTQATTGQQANSYGTMSALRSISSIDDLRQTAQKSGWADPTAFNLDMLEGITEPEVIRDENSLTTSGGSARFKKEFADARGMGDGSNVQNNVQVKYLTEQTGTREITQGEHGDQYTVQVPIYKNTVDGYRVMAGAVQGEKRPTTMFYEYDKDGNFKGLDFEVETKWYEDLAPVIGMGLAMFGVPALAGALAPTFGSVTANVLAGGLTGGVTSEIAGGDFADGFKGGAIGAGVGQAVQAINPAGVMDITNPTLAKAVNSGITNVAKTVATGGSGSDALRSAAISGAVDYLDPGASIGLNGAAAARFNNVAKAGVNAAAAGKDVGSAAMNALLTPVKQQKDS